MHPNGHSAMHSYYKCDRSTAVHTHNTCSLLEHHIAKNHNINNILAQMVWILSDVIKHIKLSNSSN